MSATVTVPAQGETPSGTPVPAARGASAPAAQAAPQRARGKLRERLALAGLLVATGVFWLWNLSINGYANSFYTAAIQAGSKSWSAFLWGSSDAAGSITVDKPPASLWLPELSVRVFGLSSWAVLVPEVLMGVATVWLLYAAVRRRFGTGGALLAGGVLALTPVATEMFRFDNPDALLVLLMTAAAYCVLRAVEDGRTRWMLLAGAAIGLGFLTKQLQAFLVLPGFALAYLWAAPVPLRRRVRDGLLAVGAVVVSAGWWVLLTVVVPAGSRPYIGGSQHNSFLELTFGYNGFGRITGDETGSVGAGAGGAGAWGATGITRLFGAEFGGQWAWLAPAALILGGAGLLVTARARRTDARRAAFVVWGGWGVVTLLVFSFMGGIFHQYYTVALTPAVAALVGMGGSLLWTRRESWWAASTLALASVMTGWWGYELLGRSPEFVPWLRGLVLLGGILGALGIVGGVLAGRLDDADALSARIAAGGAALAVVAGLAGPAAYSVQTVATSHTGSIVLAGPDVQTTAGGFGFGGGRAPGAGGPGGGFGGGPRGQGQQGTGRQVPSTGAGGAGGFGSSAGGLLEGAAVSGGLKAALLADADDYSWVAATTGSQNAASYQLATQKSVMPIGGFNGSDPSPTLAQFEAYVAQGRIHYYVSSGSGGTGGLAGQDGGSQAAAQIEQWVESHFTETTVDGVTLYDLTQPSSSTESGTTTVTDGA